VKSKLWGLITALITCFVFPITSQAVSEKTAIEQEIAEFQTDLVRMDEQIVDSEQIIQKRAELANEQLRDLQLQNDYKMGLHAIFQSKSIEELIRSFRALTRVRRSQNDEIRSLIEELERLKKLRKEKEHQIRQKEKSLIDQQQMDQQITDGLSQKVDFKVQSMLLSDESAMEFQNQGNVMLCNATAYSCEAASMGRFTAFGIDLWTNPRVLAVDPDIIPLGTMVEVLGYGIYIAGDTGSAIKGNHIDIHFPTYQESCEFGRQDVLIRIL